MEQQIISNKVYESLQVPTENTRTTTGKVLYANKYSGVAEVAMPEDLKALIDSDFGLVGKNVLVQLEQKMKGYTNGPWYVDSRDGVIYIHNRKFNEEPVCTYTYQGENGEVLRVSFATQEITKRVKAVLAPSLDPDSKDLSVLSTNINEPEDKPPLALRPPEAQVDNLMVSNITGNGFEDYRSYPTTPTGVMDAWDTQLQYNMEKTAEYKKRVEEYEAVGPVGAYEAGKQRKFDEMSTEELRDTINRVANELPDDKKNALKQVLRNSKNGKELEANLKKLLEYEMYLFEDEDGMEFMVVEYVDPLDYDPEGYTSKQAGAGIASGFNFQAGVLPASERGFEALKKDPYTEVLSDMEVDTTKGYGQNQYGKRVKVRHMKRVNLKVSLYKLYHNLFSRYGGADKYAWAANANANGGLKQIEKKLICQLQVVGRPMLATSQIIRIDNVGKRWSGLWYIKQCTHSMDAGQGYITNMELVKNNSKSGSVTSKTDLSTQNIVANDAKANAKTTKGQDKKALSTSQNLNLNFTYNEKVYYNEHFLNDKGDIIDIKGQAEFIRKKAYYTEVNADNPQALAEGIVLSTGNTVTSKGKLIPGEISVKQIQVPEDYRVKFNYMAIASRIYRDIAKRHKRIASQIYVEKVEK
jgi:hypothetical protein